MDSVLPYLQTLDGLEHVDSACPCPSYPALRTQWFDAACAHLQADAECEIDDDVAAFVEDAMTLFLETHTTAGPWCKRPPTARAAHVAALLDKPNVGQRTQEWYAQSRTVLTASEFSAILGTPRAFGVLAQSKAAPPPDAAAPTSSRLACSTLEMSPMDWGVRFEPVVKQVLEERWDAHIVDVGRLLHPTLPHLAASPDGLVLRASDPDRVGRLVEIKCPVKRVITGEIPFEYWCQMQIQMEVTDIDECEYVEVKLAAAYKSEPAAVLAGPPAAAGTLWLLQHPDTLELKYAYTAAERANLEACEWTIVETIPWAVETIATRVVARDRAWFESTRQKQDEFWAAVAAAREGTYVLPASSRPARAPAAAKPTVHVCKIED